MIGMSRAWLVLLTMLLAGSTTAGAASPADWGRLDRLATGRMVSGPAGWLNWCMGDIGRCRPVGSAAPVPATPELLALLADVQVEVNARLTPLAEPPGQDLWRADARSGDCEDFALAKQVRLQAAGLPDGAVRLATARLPHGELHAVLTVETDRGTLVLDNLQLQVVPVNALDYAWLRVQGSGDGLRWQELGDGQAPSHPMVPRQFARGATRTADATGTIGQ
jgi:predicted transglutaminase-like cysteine proteinase